MTPLAGHCLTIPARTGTDMGFVLDCLVNGHVWTLYKVDEIHYGTAQEGGIEKNYYYKCKVCLKDMYV